MIAASKTVVAHTKNGPVRAMFGSPAVHVRKDYTEMGPSVDELWLDFGVKDGDAVKALGVEVGTLVTFDDKYHRLGDYHVGKALDNKLGGYIIAQAMRVLKYQGVELGFNLCAVNSVQEEVGLFGARLIAQRIKADIAIVHDVCHNTNHPKMNKAKDGDIKGGAGFCLEFTAQNHRGIISKVREVCDSKEIPYQLAVGSYGNDTVSFFLENTPTAILATPLKYMHTTVEAAHVDDLDNAVLAFVEVLKSIDADWISEISDFKKIH
jgi:putative aminopeptidase FrvX